MAAKPTTTARAVWNAALAERDAIIHQLKHHPDPHLDEQLVAAEERLLDLGAPDLEGVIAKLMILWSQDMHLPDVETRRKLTVIGDLRRLTAP